MISRDALAGYVLEEVLARMIQSAGYRLITSSAQDPHELTTGRTGDLQIKGRGAAHQVDVLGEFTVVPAFSNPLRLIVEAKARKRVTSISVVRNGVGTVNDVNEAWMVEYSINRARRHYRYAIFATGGFSPTAQDYALAHEIALVDLSGPEWRFLRDVVRNSAEALLNAVPRDLAESLPRSFDAHCSTTALGTALMETDPYADETDMGGTLNLSQLSNDISDQFDSGIGDALLVSPAGQQVLLARPENLRAFLSGR